MQGSNRHGEAPHHKLAPGSGASSPARFPARPCVGREETKTLAIAAIAFILASITVYIFPPRDASLYIFPVDRVIAGAPANVAAGVVYANISYYDIYSIWHA